MRLISFAILCLSLAGCRTPSIPKPPVVPYCPLITVEGGIPYLNCQMGSDDSTKWKVRIDDKLWQNKTKFICTTERGYADAWEYGEKLERWIGKNCGKQE